MEFEKKKQDILSKLETPQLCDKSVKGGVDAPIIGLIELINSKDCYISTSSCSGRVSIFAAANEDNQIKQKGTGWLLISHDPVNLDDLNFDELYSKIQGEFAEAELISFKFEPFIIHVQCRTLNDAQLLLNAALDAGYRNSGIVLGKKNINVAIRNTILLDAPIASQSKLLVDETYLKLLFKLANQKFVENEKRIQRLYDSISFFTSNISNDHQEATPLMLKLNSELQTKTQKKTKKYINPQSNYNHNNNNNNNNHSNSNNTNLDLKRTLELNSQQPTSAIKISTISFKQVGKDKWLRTRTNPLKIGKMRKFEMRITPLHSLLTSDHLSDYYFELNIQLVEGKEECANIYCCSEEKCCSITQPQCSLHHRSKSLRYIFDRNHRNDHQNDVIIAKKVDSELANGEYYSCEVYIKPHWINNVGTKESKFILSCYIKQHSLPTTNLLIYTSEISVTFPKWESRKGADDDNNDDNAIHEVIAYYPQC